MKLACALMASITGVVTAQVEIETETFGVSRSGTDLEVFTIAAAGEVEPGDRPALLIIAGVEPEHRVGVDVARALAERDWSDAGALLSTHTLYIVPCLNPDGLGWLGGERGPTAELGRTVSPFDADRDGRLGEDPPEDLNGDGVISMMRVYDPPAGYTLETSLVAEPDEPRLSRAAKSEEGEVGRFALLTEGTDNDDDGRFNEDGGSGPGSGVSLNLNFPTHFPEFREGAGARPLSEPESRSLVDWMQAHRNITGVLVLGRGDSLLNKPATGKYDETGRIPEGLEKDDEAYRTHIAELYKDAVSIEQAAEPNYEGSLLSWAYADFGAWAFESAVWSRPKSEKKAPEAEGGADAPESVEPEPEVPADPASERDALIEQGVPERIAAFLTATPEERQAMAAEFEASSEEERAAAMEQVRALSPELQARMSRAIQETAGGGAGADPPPEAAAEAPKSATKPNDSDDGRWLAYSDETRDRTGFIDWTEFDHPQLGRVEIGGFVPGFRVNPPEGMTQQLADEQAAFALKLLENLPRIELSEAVVERLGEQLWRVSVEVCNTGYLPTSSAVGLKIRQPIAVDLAVSPDQVVVGRRVLTLDRLLGSGACERVEWLITGDEGGEVGVEVRSARFGSQRVNAVLEGDRP